MTRAALFLSGPAERAVPVIERARAEHPDAEWTVVVRGRDARWLSTVLVGTETVDDKPAGGKVAFLKGLRARRFDVVLVWFSDESSYDPVKLVGFFAGGRTRRWITADDSGALTFAGALRRLLRTKGWRREFGQRVLGVVFACYRNTLGRPVGALLRARAGRRLLKGRR